MNIFLTLLLVLSITIAQAYHFPKRNLEKELNIVVVDDSSISQPTRTSATPFATVPFYTTQAFFTTQAFKSFAFHPEPTSTSAPVEKKFFFSFL